MENWLDKFGAILGAIITALGGFYMYDRKVTNDRITKIEQDSIEHKISIREIQTRIDALKEDTQEIKESQKDIIQLLTRKRK